MKSDMAHWVASGLRFDLMGVMQRKIWVIRAHMDSDLALWGSYRGKFGSLGLLWTQIWLISVYMGLDFWSSGLTVA